MYQYPVCQCALLMAHLDICQLPTWYASASQKMGISHYYDLPVIVLVFYLCELQMIKLKQWTSDGIVVMYTTRTEKPMPSTIAEVGNPRQSTSETWGRLRATAANRERPSKTQKHGKRRCGMTNSVTLDRFSFGRWRPCDLEF